MFLQLRGQTILSNEVSKETGQDQDNDKPAAEMKPVYKSDKKALPAPTTTKSNDCMIHSSYFKDERQLREKVECAPSSGAPEHVASLSSLRYRAS